MDYFLSQKIHSYQLPDPDAEFQDVIISASGNDSSWTLPMELLGVQDVVAATKQCALPPILATQTKGEYDRTYVHKSGLPFLTAGVSHY